MSAGKTVTLQGSKLSAERQDEPESKNPLRQSPPLRGRLPEPEPDENEPAPTVKPQRTSEKIAAALARLKEKAEPEPEEPPQRDPPVRGRLPELVPDNEPPEPNSIKPEPEAQVPPVADNYKLSKDQSTAVTVPKGEVKAGRATAEQQALFQKLNAQVDQLIKRTGFDSLALCEILHKIQRDKLYLCGGDKTYEAYCRKKSDLGRSTLFQYSKIGRICEVVGRSTSVDYKPTSIRQLRPLVDVASEEQVVEIWKRARFMGDGRVTEQAVAKAKRSVLGQPEAKPKSDHVLRKELESKFTKAIRFCWDAWPEDEKVIMVFRLLAFTGALIEELMQEEVFDEQVEMELRNELGIIGVTKKFLSDLRDYFKKTSQAG